MTVLAYPTDQRKINTAISYFEGLALDWITPFLLTTPVPALLTDWNTFVRGLHEMFGDKNIASRCRPESRSGYDEDSHHAQRYIIDFAQWPPSLDTTTSLLPINSTRVSRIDSKIVSANTADRPSSSNFAALLAPRRTTLGTSFRDVRLQKRVHFPIIPSRQYASYQHGGLLVLNNL